MTAQEIGERLLQDAVIDCARTLGWRVAHFRPALTKHGWRTPVQADGKGYPDLTLVRERIIFAELKRQGEKPSVEQQQWLDALRAAGCEVYLWTPADWLEGAVERVLGYPHHDPKEAAAA